MTADTFGALVSEMLLETRDALEAWLDANCWLNDLVVEELVGLDTASPDSGVHRIRARMQTGGSLVAGERRRVRLFDLIPRGIVEFSLDRGGFSPGHCSEGADLFPADAPIAFEIDVPGLLRLACRTLEVLESDRFETVPPWYSNRDFWTQAPGTPPTPVQWCERFRGEGLSVVWRFYGGPATDAASVPEDYTGWFLQLEPELDSDDGGLFFESLRRSAAGFSMTITSSGQTTCPLWLVAGRIVASLQSVEVRCGNVQMTGTAWREYLDRLRTAEGA